MDAIGSGAIALSCARPADDFACRLVCVCRLAAWPAALEPGGGPPASGRSSLSGDRPESPRAPETVRPAGWRVA